jgi:hypothetical protein
MNQNISFSKKKYTLVFSIFTIISFIIPAIPWIYRDFKYPEYLNFLNNDILQLILGICFPLFWIVAFSLLLMHLGEKYVSWEIIVNKYRGAEISNVKVTSPKMRIGLIFFLFIPTLLFLYTYFTWFPYYEILLANIFYIPIVWSLYKK